MISDSGDMTFNLVKSKEKTKGFLLSSLLLSTTNEHERELLVIQSSLVINTL